MSFMTSLAKATNWLDSTIGTGGAISRTVLPALGSAQSFYYKNIEGTFIGDVGKELTAGFVDKDGKNQYSVPLPQVSSPGFKSRVRSGSFSAGQAKSFGWNNPKVQQAFAKAQQSQNPSIRAAIDAVRPTIGKKGPTKSLREAQIG